MKLPEGYALRRPRADEAGAVAELMTVADAVSGEAWSAADIEREWRSLDPGNDAWVVAAPSGGLAAYLETARREERRVASDGYVHPDHVDRGLGSALVDILEEHAREVVGPEAVVSSGTLSANARALALFESKGFRPVRHFFRMLIELEEEPPEPAWPDGLDPRPFDTTYAEQFHAATEEAFAEEWGNPSETFESWRSRRLEAPDATPELWLAVWDADEIAATLICDRKRFGFGWIASVAVRERWRRRGLGLALLHQAFGRFWALGERRVALGVDAENPTGATRLYERAGMDVLFDYVVLEKALG